MEKTFGRYWKENLVMGARRSWEWMGVREVLVGVLLALGVGLFVGQRDIFRIGTTTLLVALVLYAVIALVFLLREPVLRHNQQAGEISALGARLSIKEYDDIDLVYFPLAETIEEKRESIRYHHPTENKRLSYLIRNSGAVRIKECRITMLSVVLRDSPNVYYSDTTNLPPEDKPIKWQNHDLETIPIGSRTSEPVVLARISDNSAFRMFHFVVYGESADISKRVARVFEGTWETTIQIEGQAEKEGRVVDLDPIKYAVSFEFSQAGLRPLNVKKLGRP